MTITLFSFFSGLFSFLFGIALLVSCFSYSSSDSSFNASSDLPPQNILGEFGAFSSDILFQFFGSAGLLIPFAFLFLGVSFLKNTPRLKYRACFFTAGLFLLCWLLGLTNIPSSAGWRDISGGGVVGLYFKNWFILQNSYLRCFAWVLAIGLVVFSLNIPIFKFSFWTIKKSKTTTLHFNIPHFKLPKFSHKVKDSHFVVKENTPDVSSQTNDSVDTEKTPFLKRLHFSIPSLFRKKSTSQINERIEPSFENEIFSTQPNHEQHNFTPNVQDNKVSEPHVHDKAIETASKPVVLKQEPNSPLELPSSTLLDPIKTSSGPALSHEQMSLIGKELEEVLTQFSIGGQIIGARPGPVVTLYEFQPAPGIKSTRIISLADDIAMKMCVVSVRIAVIPGTNAIGIEMPNIKREVVYIREMIEDNKFKNNSGSLPLILGKDIGGTPVFADLAKMPHLLVAGTTGSGKSVAINTMVLSLLYRFTPSECKLIMVDPKMVELSVYNRIPHLLTPVVVEPEKAVIALKWAVREMEDRYRSMSHLGVRNIDGYNQKLKQAAADGKALTRRVQTGFDPETGRPIYEEQEFDLTPIPYIVIIVDEMADLMGRCGKEVDPLIQRLAQMARAVGIHLILATQRPSVDVITGTIKSNFPSRMSFQVRSKIDSRTILDEQGAEQLLGKGDMLFMPAGQKPQRVHGPFVSDNDVERVVHHWEQQAEPQYLEAVTTDVEDSASSASNINIDSGSGDLYDKAVAIVLRDNKVSTSYVQRQLRIGYNKAADLIDRMEAEGVISKPNLSGKREILVPTVNA